MGVCRKAHCHDTNVTWHLEQCWFWLSMEKNIQDWALGYEVYLTNGFDESIISNTENKTFLAMKNTADRFERSSNGQPLLTGKIAVRKNNIGEIGLSYMGGVYNKFEEDGLVLDDKRRLHVVAIDFNSVIPLLKTYVVGEMVWVNLDIADAYGQQYGEKQYGGFVDFVQPGVAQNHFRF